MNYELGAEGDRHKAIGGKLNKGLRWLRHSKPELGIMNLDLGTSKSWKLKVEGIIPFARGVHCIFPEGRNTSPSSKVLLQNLYQRHETPERTGLTWKLVYRV